MERLLTTEAHHRIKNNLQLVADLLILEADRARDNPSVVVEETLSRIQSVAAVHQSLAQRSAGRVALRPVIERIAGLVGDRLGRKVQVDGDDVTLSGRAATWTALVANELVVNALRHGRGDVTICLDADPAGKKPSWWSRTAGRDRRRWLRGSGSPSCAASSRKGSAAQCPARSGTAATASRFASRSERRWRTMRVLIAEDDPVIALGLETKLAALGHEVVARVADGLSAGRRSSPDAPRRRRHGRGHARPRRTGGRLRHHPVPTRAHRGHHSP